MIEVLLLHHVQGITDGIRSFADALRAEGHSVHVPDLFDGRTFNSIDEGVAFVEPQFDALVQRAVASADRLGNGLVTAGFSLGAVPAQKLAQTRPGVLGVLLYDGGNPVSAFSECWPPGVELQVHVVLDDEWIELDAVRQLAADANGDLFVYPGAAHLIADSSSAAHEPQAAALILERTISFLRTIEIQRSGCDGDHRTPGK